MRKAKLGPGLPSLSPVSRVTASVQHVPPSLESYKKAATEGAAAAAWARVELEESV